MIKVVNELVEKRGLTAAQVYTDFGLQQLSKVNAQTERWLAGQAFAEYAPSPLYNKMEVTGFSNDRLHSIGEVSDKVEWELEFAYQLPDMFKSSWTESAFHHGLLHIDQLPNLSKYNSAPGIFDTSDYIQISVFNGERGWVERGEFPTNVHVRKGSEIIEGERGFIPRLKKTETAVFTSIKRDAEAGFSAAREWAKFRTMALAASGYLFDRLRGEWEETTDWNGERTMRDRSERTFEVMLGLLPDTTIRSGPAALKRYYEPGILEATVALELERGISSNLGRDNRPRPFYGVKGSPIEVTNIPGKTLQYDAMISLNLPVRSFLDDEAVRGKLEREAGKYFDVTTNSKGLNVKLHIPNAHEVRAAIAEGKEDTILHRQTRGLIEMTHSIALLSHSWTYEQVPVLEEGYKAMIEAGKAKHFERLEYALSMNSAVRSLKRE